MNMFGSMKLLLELNIIFKFINKGQEILFISFHEALY